MFSKKFITRNLIIFSLTFFSQNSFSQITVEIGNNTGLAPGEELRGADISETQDLTVRNNTVITPGSETDNGFHIDSISATNAVTDPTLTINNENGIIDVSGTVSADGETIINNATLGNAVDARISIGTLTSNSGSTEDLTITNGDLGTVEIDDLDGVSFRKITVTNNGGSITVNSYLPSAFVGEDAFTLNNNNDSTTNFGSIVGGGSASAFTINNNDNAVLTTTNGISISNAGAIARVNHNGGTINSDIFFNVNLIDHEYNYNGGTLNGSVDSRTSSLISGIVTISSDFATRHC